MPNTELPIDLENQVVLMKKYVNFRQRKKIRDFLGYAGYFRASRYGKYFLTQVNAFGSKADAKVFLNFMILMCNLDCYCLNTVRRLKSILRVRLQMRFH